MPDWVPDAVVYEIVPDRLEPPRSDELEGLAAEAFEPWSAPPQPKAYKGGNLWGVVRHLERIAELGATALYLTPVTASPTYHRYKPLDWTRVDPLLGGEAAFDALLAAAHARGLRVVLDLVVNHVGIGFLPFADVMEYGERSPYRSWFHIERFPVRPFAVPRGFRSWNDNATMPVLNHANPAVRRGLIDGALSFVRRGVDGLRLDAAAEIEDDGFFEALREAVKREREEVWILGEAWGDARRWLDGRKWDGATNYPLHFAIRSFAGRSRHRREHLHPGSVPEGGIDAAEYARRLEASLAQVPRWHREQALNFLDGHDVARFRTAVGGDEACEGLARLLLFASPGAPSIYYGEEAGLEGGMPPDCRRGLVPRAAFDRAAEAQVQDLIRLRRAHPALRRGEPRILQARGGLYAELRESGADALVVAVNASGEPATLLLDPRDLPPSAGSDAALPRALPAFRLRGAQLERDGGRLRLRLPPWSALVVDLLGSGDSLPAGAAAHAVGRAPEVAVVGNIGVDTNVYLRAPFGSSPLESAFTEDLDSLGQAGGYSAFAFARLGLRTAVIAAVGDDALGGWIRRELDAAGIGHHLETDPAGTQRSVNLVAPDGTRRCFYDGKSHMTLLPDLGRCRALLSGARLAHFHLPNWSRRLLPFARERGLVISTDLQDMTSPDDPYRRDFVEASDFLFCSAVNLPPEALGPALLRVNPRATVVFGMGARGAGLYTREGFRRFPPFPLEAPIVDPNGAGDSLAAGFLTAHVMLHLPVDEALRWGQAAARFATTLRQKWRRLATREQLAEILARPPATTGGAAD